MSRRKKYSLYHERVQIALELFSGGMPARCVAEESGMSTYTLYKLINEYKKIHGEHSLRTKHVGRGKADRKRYI